MPIEETKVNKWLFDRRSTRATGRFVRACGIAMLCLFMLVGNAIAQTIESEWNVETRFYLSGMSFYWETGDDSTSYETVAATGELRFRLAARPWYASLFADYRFSTDGRHTDHVNLGGLFKYGWEKWDATTYVFVNQSPRTDKTWLYAGRLRYYVAENHKLGIEAYGQFGNAHSPQLMLGYYGDISDSVSLNLALGPLTSSGPDLSARLELVWQVF
jgi:hypothetical protein